MKKYHNSKLFNLFSKFTKALQIRVSALIHRLTQKKKLEYIQNSSFNLPQKHQNSNNIKMGLQIDIIEIINIVEDEKGNNDVVIIKLSNPEIRLEPQDNSNMDPFEKQLNNHACIPFPPSTRIH